MKLTTRKTPAGLTRLELLIVIVIIIVLVSPLLPTLNRAKAKRGRIKCLSNQKQIGTAFRVFASDNGDLFPLQARGNSYIYQPERVGTDPGAVASTNAQAWQVFQAIWNELQTPKILLCPDDLARRPYNRVTDFNGLANAPSQVTNTSLGYPDNQNRAVSYAPQSNANETSPLGIVALDNNINFATEKSSPKTEAPASGSRFSIISPEQARWVYWVKGRTLRDHELPGNLTFADGSVRGTDSPALRRTLYNSGTNYGWGTPAAPGPGASVFLMP